MTTGFVCPHCSGPLQAEARTCPACGMRLFGPSYERLWHVTRTIHQLEQEAAQLKAALLLPPDPAVPAEQLAAAPPYPTSADRTPATAPPSGQQVVLGLGALLLLAASSIFVLAIWFLVGVWGQAAIMVALTVAAVQGGRLAARRGLDAASETASVIATGLALLDAVGARRFGLFDLDALSPEVFGALATAIVGGLALGFDRLSLRTTRAGGPARLPLVYRPAAAVLLGLTPWFLLAAAKPDVPGLPLVVGLLLVAFAQAATTAAFSAIRQPGRTGLVPPAGLAAAAATAYGLHLFVAFAMAHDVEHGTLARYAAFAFLVLPLAGLSHPVVRGRIPAEAVVAAALVLLTVPLGDLPGWGLVAVAAVVAVALGWSLQRPDGPLRVGLAMLLWMVAAAGIVIDLAQAPTLHRLGESGPDDQLLPALAPVGLLALVTAFAAVRTRAVPWAAQAQVALVVFVARALVHRPDDVVWWVLVALVAAEGALAVAVARQRALSLMAITCAGLYGVAAAGFAAAELGPYELAASCFVVGVTMVAFAATPGRLGFAYLGVLANAAGGWVLTNEAGVDTIEAYSFPLAAMLAVIGVVQLRRQPDLPTAVTMGPALSVLLGPSLLLAILDGDALRLALVTVGGITSLLVGYAEKWRAPVTSGVVVLGAIGVTQGGPLLEYVNAWVTLGLAGAVLLTVGVRFESAVNAGRRGAAWFGSLS